MSVFPPLPPRTFAEVFLFTTLFAYFAPGLFLVWLLIGHRHFNMMVRWKLPKSAGFLVINDILSKTLIFTKTHKNPRKWKCFKLHWRRLNLVGIFLLNLFLKKCGKSCFPLPPRTFAEAFLFSTLENCVLAYFAPGLFFSMVTNPIQAFCRVHY